MVSPRILIPEIMLPKHPGDTLRELQAARDGAYRRATDPLCRLRDPRGAVPMRGAYAMPESRLGQA